MLSLFQEKYKQLNTFFLKISKMRFFNEVYIGLIALVTIFGWGVHCMAGMALIIIVALLVLVLTQDLKYVIPHCVYFIFMLNDGFANDSIPIPIIILGSLFILVMTFFSFRKGFKKRRMHSLIGLTGLAITTLIPIIWCRAPEGNEVFYFLFFADFGYLLLYIILVNGIKEKALDVLAVTMSYLIVILACECAIKVYSLRDEYDNILKLWYYLGWGLCNEAGIMICMALPFAFYLLGKQRRLSGMVFQNCKIWIAIIGIILTTSRGSYLFGACEIAVLYLVLLFTSQNKRVYQNAFLIYFLTILILLVCLKDQCLIIIDDVLELVFSHNLDDNGRKEIWEKSYALWKENPLTRLLGPGILCDVRHLNTAGGTQLGPVVFHSTFFETLITGGLFGLLFLIVHFIEKYKNLYKCGKTTFLVLGIGYGMVDIYGMIDNTYHMYYYMIPLVVVMAVIDVEIDTMEIPMELDKLN